MSPAWVPRPGGAATGTGHGASGQLWPVSGDYKDPIGGGALVQSPVLGQLQSPTSSLLSGVPVTGDGSSVRPEWRRGAGGLAWAARSPWRLAAPSLGEALQRAAQRCWLDARGPGGQGGERLLAASWAADLPDLRPEPKNLPHPCGIN